MTLVRQLDANGDWTFGAGRQNYISGNAAVMQNIATRLRMFRGDCFFDTTAGVDWLNLLGQKDQTALQLAIAAVILNTQDVIKLVQLKVSLSADRNLSVSYRVQTTYSSETFGGVQLDLTSLIGG